MTLPVGCSERLREAGQPYPRNCVVCGPGPCRGTAAAPASAAKVVVGLFEDAILPGQPHDELIAHLEALLDKARNGTLRGIAYATVEDRGGNLNIYDNWMCAAGSRWAMSAAVMRLHAAMGRDISDSA